MRLGIGVLVVEGQGEVNNGRNIHKSLGRTKKNPALVGWLGGGIMGNSNWDTDLSHDPNMVPIWLLGGRRLLVWD
jgi:hypothetical protein